MRAALAAALPGALGLVARAIPKANVVARAGAGRLAGSVHLEFYLR